MAHPRIPSRSSADISCGDCGEALCGAWPRRLPRSGLPAPRAPGDAPDVLRARRGDTCRGDRPLEHGHTPGRPRRPLRRRHGHVPVLLHRRPGARRGPRTAPVDLRFSGTGGVPRAHRRRDRGLRSPRRGRRLPARNGSELPRSLLGRRVHRRERTRLRAKRVRARRLSLPSRFSRDRAHPVHLRKHRIAQGRRRDAPQSRGEHARQHGGRALRSLRSVALLVAALPRHGARRRIAARSLPGHRYVRYAYAVVRRTAGLLAPRDEPVQGDVLVRPQFRVQHPRPTAPGRRARGHRPVELAPRIQRR